MARMLRKSTTRFFGCCDACASGKRNLSLKPGPRERHQARAVEKRAWKKEASA